MISKFKLIALLVSIFLLGFSTTYLVLKKTSSARPSVSSTPTPQSKNYGNVFESASDTPNQAEGTFNAVLLGIGGAGHSGGQLTDSIIVVSVNSKTNKATLISIPRDLWVNGNRKINADVINVGYTGFESTLQGVTGLPINKYASIDFGGIIKLIDSLGGITVDVPKTFDDAFYPITGLENETCGKTAEEIASFHQKYSGFELEKQFTCRYEHLHFDKGQAKLDGATALKFARSRHGDSDFGRSERQFAILKGVVKKLSTQSPYKSIDDAYNSISKLLKSDLSLNETLKLFDLYGNPEKYTITEIHLTTENVLNQSKSADGQFILVPKAGNFNFSEIKKFISSQ